MDLSGAPASGGVAEISEPGSQMYFNLYLNGAKLYSKSDSNQVGIRVSQLTSSDVQSIYLRSQYRWKSDWSLAAKLRFDTRNNDNGSSQKNMSPSLRMQYQNKQHYFYLDFGAIFYTNEVVNFGNISTDIYYTYLGYRHFF